MTRQDFVRKYWALAAEVGGQFNISPVAMLAHALKESGANNQRAAQRHNYFGFLRHKQHVVYPDDLTGFTAYARRMTTTFAPAAKASQDAARFAQAVAYASKPDYVTGSAATKAQYQRTLTSIYRSVAADVARFRLDQPALAGLTSTPTQTALVSPLVNLLGSVIGAALTPENRYKGIFLGGLVGGLAGSALTVFGRSSGLLAGLAGLPLEDLETTPLKRRPIVIVRPGAITPTGNADLRLRAPAAARADRLLL